MDTAAAYGGGRSEELIGAVLAKAPGLREQIELVTKCAIGSYGTSLYHYNTEKDSIVSELERSLRRMSTDHVDVLLLHRPDPLMDADEVAEAFVQLRESGKVLHFGVSNFTPPQFELLSSRLGFPLITNEIEFSVLHLDPCRDGTLDMCQRLRISPMFWGPLGGGRLFQAVPGYHPSEDTKRVFRVRGTLQEVGEELGGASTDQVAITWLLKHPANGVVLLGSGALEEISSVVRACELDLSREQWFRVWVASTGSKLP